MSSVLLGTCKEIQMSETNPKFSKMFLGFTGSSQSRTTTSDVKVDTLILRQETSNEKKKDNFLVT